VRTMGEMEKKWGLWILVLGGVVWGLVGLGYFLGTNLNILNLIFGSLPVVENAVYVIVGICALWIGWMQMEKK